MSEALDFPATGRNRDAIFATLTPWLPRAGHLLEVASGSGQHLTYFAERSRDSHPDLRLWPSDPEPEHRDSIAAWTGAVGVEDRVGPPLPIDATDPGWPSLWPPTGVDEAPGLVFCANMIHIAPWAACEGLLTGAGALLEPGGALVLYGPFMRGGAHTAPSNAAFSARLTAQDPRWGVRDLDVVAARAEATGLALDEVVEMPANNLTVRFRRR